VAPEKVKPYAVGHYWLGVTNDIFNGVGTPGLVTCHTALGQQCDIVLLSHLAL
jgi:hypothetical protein